MGTGNSLQIFLNKFSFATREDGQNFLMLARSPGRFTLSGHSWCCKHMLPHDSVCTKRHGQAASQTLLRCYVMLHSL